MSDRSVEPEATEPEDDEDGEAYVGEPIDDAEIDAGYLELLAEGDG